jgi:hypothetical protein
MPTRLDPQLNVRLSKSHRAVLDAAAFVHETTATRIVQELAERAIADYEEQPTVQKALEARAEQASANAAKVAHLSDDRARRANAARPESSQGTRPTDRRLGLAGNETKG